MSSTLVIIGPSCAGKGTVGQYLKTKGYRLVIGSDMVRDVIPLLYPSIKEETIFDMVDTVREEFGTEYFAEMINNTITRQRDRWDRRTRKEWDKVAIDGLRHPDEIAYFKDRGVPILGVDAPYELREARYMERKRVGDGDGTAATFKAYDLRDRGLLSDRPEYGTRVDDCMLLADRIITNIASEEALYSEVDRSLNAFGLEGSRSMPEGGIFSRFRRRESQ